jgi:hypothetical protein
MTDDRGYGDLGCHGKQAGIINDQALSGATFGVHYVRLRKVE